jgi:hypothetical protein
MRFSDTQLLLNIPSLLVTPNVSSFEARALQPEHATCAAAIPIINVENLNVFSVDESGQFNAEPTDRSTMSNPADCVQAKLAATATIAFSLVKFFNNQNTSNHFMEESRTNICSSASSCSVRTIQTIELGNFK